VTPACGREHHRHFHLRTRRQRLPGRRRRGLAAPSPLQRSVYRIRLLSIVMPGGGWRGCRQATTHDRCPRGHRLLYSRGLWGSGDGLSIRQTYRDILPSFCFQTMHRSTRVPHQFLLTAPSLMHFYFRVIYHPFSISYIISSTGGKVCNFLWLNGGSLLDWKYLFFPPANHKNNYMIHFIPQTWPYDSFLLGSCTCVSGGEWASR